MSESASETRRATTVMVTERERKKEKGREREKVGRGCERNRCEKEERDGKRASRNARPCMRLGNTLIGLSDSFRVAPYRRDRFRFDKIEFHLTRVEYREPASRVRARVHRVILF